MFKWLKRKLNYLLPDDIDEGMMSCTFCTIKLGEKISIPENCICLVTYKDKVYNTLQTGNHTLNKELLLDLYQKQLKKQNELIKLKVDFFFINTKAFTYSFDYFDKVPINNKLSKILFNVKININVEQHDLFSSNILSEFASVSALSCEQLILDYVQILIKQFFLHKELDNFSIPESTHEEIKEKLTKQLKKIGLSLNLLKVSITSNNKESKTNLAIKQNHQENIMMGKENKTNYLTQNTIDQTENKYYNEENSITKNKPLTHCPKCNCKVINGSLYCHRCGNYLK